MDGAVTRREFLKLAGITGATLAVGASSAALLAGCGEETVTTETVSTTQPPGGGDTTLSTAGSTTTVSADAEMGDEFKVGIVAPNTGGLASFAGAQKWCAERWTEFAAD